MGLSSSKTKTKTDQNTTGTTSATSTPITPDWLMEGAQDYTQRIADFGNMDPNSFVAGASPLQQQAWGNVGQLSGWQPQAATASGMAQSIGNSGPNLAAVPQQQPQMTGMKPQQAQAPLRSTELRPPGETLSPQGYSAAPSQPGYAMPRSGVPIGGQPAVSNGTAQAVGQGYATPQLGDPSLAAGVSGASQMSAYQNPWDDQVVNSTLQGYDRNAAEQAAQLAGRGAASGAFGGSRYGLAEGQFAADTALGRAQTEAGLRQTGFNTAAGYGMMDADRQQNVNLANAGAENQFGLAQAGLNENAGQFGAGAMNSASLFNAGALNQMSQFNAGQADNAANRQLQAAGLMGDLANSYSANTRADLGTMSQLGGDQRAIEQQYAMAPLAQLEAMGQLSGMTPYDILVGRQQDGTMTGTMQGTNVTKSTPSLFSQMLQLGQAGAQAYAGGMGG